MLSQKRGDEGTQQYGTQEYLSPAPTVDSGTTAVDDLIPNDRQIPEQVVQRALSFQVVQSAHRVPDSTSEAGFPHRSATGR